MILNQDGGMQDVRPGGLELQVFAECCGPCGRGRHLIEPQKVLATHHQIRGPADFFGGHAVDFRDFADRGAKTQGVLIRHHGGLLPAIRLEHPLKNLVSFVPWEIDVDVRRIFPAAI